MEKKKKSNSNKSNSNVKKNNVKKPTTNLSEVKEVKEAAKVKKPVADLKEIRETEKPKVDLIKIKKEEKTVVNEKYEKIKYISFAIGILLIVLGILFNNNLLETEILGYVLGDLVIPVKLIGFLILGATAITDIIIKDENSLVKSLIVVIAMGILGTWIFPIGSFTTTTFSETPGFGLDLNDFGTLIYNGINMTIDKLMILVFIGVFYKVADATGAYRKTVTAISNKFKGKEKNCAIAVASIIIILISFVSEIFIVLFFIPFFISILANLKVDKITAFAVTFGALIAGTIGSPYGTEGLGGFNYYAGLTVENGLIYRYALQICVLILFAVFVSIRLKDTSKSEVVEETFLLESEDKSVNNVPFIVISVITSLLLILGNIDWVANFDIQFFTKFHEWLFGLTLGDHVIFEYLLGPAANASVFGTFTIFDAVGILFAMIVLLAVSYRINFTKLTNILKETVSYLALPLLVIVLISSIFAIGFLAQFLVSIANYLLNLSPEFNPFTSSIVAAISAIFSNDLAFTGYLYSSFFESRFTVWNDIYGVCFTSISGIVQLVIPTSPLLIGLYYTKVSYKDWIKYVSLFFAGILLITLLLLTVVTYLG